mgnify:CR=1 FL=1
MDENDNPAENLAPPLPPVPPAPPEGSSLQQKMIASTLGLIGIPVSASIIITTLLLLYASHGDAVINKYVYMGFILLILAIIAFSARMDYLFYERSRASSSRSSSCPWQPMPYSTGTSMSWLTTTAMMSLARSATHSARCSHT